MALDCLKYTQRHAQTNRLFHYFDCFHEHLFSRMCVSCGVCTYAVYELLCISVCTCSWIPTNRSQKLTSDVRFYHFLHLLFTA